MIVISDTSPINYLILIGHIDILPTLFGEVVVPTAVLDELQHPGTPQPVREWVDQSPSWLLVRTPSAVDSEIRLGRGESAAITLALELNANLLLMDDRMGRRSAESHGLAVTGTLNVLEAAAQRDLLDLPTAVAALRQTNFHISEQVIQHALNADAERKSQGK